MRKNTLRTVTAIAGSTLLLGLAACSTDDASDAVSDATDSVSSAASEVSDAAGDAKDEAEDAAGDAKDKAENTMDDAKDKADGAMDDAKDAMDHKDAMDVAEADLPSEITEAAESYDMYGENAGAFVSAYERDGVTVAEYENAAFVKSDAGTYPVIGGMWKVWQNEGGLDSEIGAPTEAEREVDGGWEQTFTGKTIHIMPNDEGTFVESFS
ncbi:MULTISPECIES: YtxH domain-containing protein [Corynebacterium]|uniref:YtxH domain-containing protein n=1 Tax=Corynebacterium TaxID=1716 RepID=UPI00124D58A2|nr:MULTISPECIES: YtxH domain-containing protein [Corynebacterium]